MRTVGIVLGLFAFTAACGGGSPGQGGFNGSGGSGGSGSGSGQGGAGGDATPGTGGGGAGAALDGPCPEGAQESGNTPCGLNERGTLMRLCTEGDWRDTPYCVDPDECIDESQEWGDVCSEGKQGLKRCNAGTWENDCVEGWTITAGSSESDVVFAGDVREDGTSYLVGHTTGNLSGENAGYDDAFLMKVAPNGKVVWKSQWGTTAPDAAHGVVATSSAIFVVGYTSSDLGGQNSGGTTDAYLRKATPTGEEVWTKQWGTLAIEAASDVFAGEHHVFVLGRTEGEIGGSNEGKSDAWLSKVDAASGAIDWTAQWGSAEYDDTARGVVDSAGDVVVVGRTEGQLGESAKVGLADAYVRKLKGGDASELWTVQLGTKAQDGALDVVVDEDDDVLVTGYTGGHFLGEKSKGGLDTFLVKLDGEDGSVVWVTQWGSDAEDRPGAFARAPSGNLYVAGSTRGTLRGLSAGQKDAFLTKLDPDGKLLWTEQWGSEGNDASLGLGLDSEEGIYVIGDTDGALTKETAGAFDAFVKRFYSH